MSKEEFNKLWALTYPNTIPISHAFRQVYTERWFRIHSLPESKRYADSNREWIILLTRQNEVITDMLGLDSSVLLITGEYIWGEGSTIHITEEVEVYKDYEFSLLDDIRPSELHIDSYGGADIYRPAFAETIWKPNKHNTLLREIANDNIRAFFVSFDRGIIVAPYDGGIDFIFKDCSEKELYKNKYKKWLSAQEDGL